LGRVTDDFLGPGTRQGCGLCGCGRFLGRHGGRWREEGMRGPDDFDLVFNFRNRLLLISIEGKSDLPCS
jgi:hypothetical protein